MILPKTRDRDVLIQNAGQELLIYDLTIDKAFNLNETSKLVYLACDGITSIEDLKSKHRGLNDEVILLAVTQLSRENLLSEKFETGISRRSLVMKAAYAGAALPLVMTIIAPTAVRALSCAPGGSPCSVNNPSACCSRQCDGTGNTPVCVAACDPGGSPCNVLNPSTCCSNQCDGSGVTPVCVAACTPVGGPCVVNNPSTCCSKQCDGTGVTPVCVS